MRYLKQKGINVDVLGRTYYLLFTLNVIDELQDKCKMPLNQLMLLLLEDKTKKITVECIIKFLINDCISRHNKENLEQWEFISTEDIIKSIENEIEYYSLLLIDTYIEQLKAKEILGITKNQQASKSKEHEFIDIEYWFYIGKVVLGYKDYEVWNMTLGSLKTLINEHVKFNGWVKEEKEVSLLDI